MEIAQTRIVVSNGRSFRFELRPLVTVVFSLPELFSAWDALAYLAVKVTIMFSLSPRKRMSAVQCLEHPWMKARKHNLNSSTTSLDSALCMDSPSSVEPSPASSTSSSFSPAPSTSTTSHSNTASSKSTTNGGLSSCNSGLYC